MSFFQCFQEIDYYLFQMLLQNFWKNKETLQFRRLHLTTAR